MAHTLDAVRGVVDSRAYDAYGMEVAKGPGGNAVAPSDPFGFDAQWGYCADREIGTYHCRNRNYAPGQGRRWEPDLHGIIGKGVPREFFGNESAGLKKGGLTGRKSLPSRERRD